MATNSKNPVFTYEICILAPPAKVCQGLADGDLTRQCVYGTRLETTLSSLKTLLESGKPLPTN